MGWGKLSNLNKIRWPFPGRTGLSDYMSDPLMSSIGMREISETMFRKRESVVCLASVTT